MAKKKMAKKKKDKYVPFWKQVDEWAEKNLPYITKILKAIKEALHYKH